MNKKDLAKAGLAFGFMVLGIYLIYFALTSPCYASLTPTIKGPSELGSPDLEMEFPPALERLVCLGTEFKLMVAIILGAAFTGSGASGFVRKLVS